MNIGGCLVENFVMIKGNVPLSALFTTVNNDVDWEKYGMCAYHCQKVADQGFVDGIYTQLLPISDMTKFNLYWEELQAFVASDAFPDDSIELLTEEQFLVQKGIVDGSNCYDPKGKKKKALKAKRDELINAGFEYNNEIFQVDTNSLANITQFASVVDDDMAPITWLGKDNLVKTFDDGNDFKKFANDAVVFVKAIYNAYNAKREQLTLAGDDEELIALVDVESGWEQ